jgi:hypothetical protein
VRNLISIQIDYVGNTNEILEKAERIKKLSDELEKETWELKKLIGNGNISGKLLPSE